MSRKKSDSPQKDLSDEAKALRVWRDREQKTYLDVAKILYGDDLEKANKNPNRIQSIQRRVGFLESGRLPLTLFLVKILQQQPGYELALADVRPRRDPLQGHGILGGPFPEEQQGFMKNYKFSYDMVFINAACIPMFEDDELRPTWIENIASGVNYVLFWDLSALVYNSGAQMAWNRFFSWLAESVAGEIVQKVGQTNRNVPDNSRGERNDKSQNKTGHGQIEVFGFYFKWDEKEPQVVKAREQIDGWQRNLTTEMKDILVIRPSFTVDEVDDKFARRLLLGFNYLAGSTLAYVPKTSKGMPVVQLELLRTSRPFGGLSTDRLHCFLGDPYLSLAIDRISAFRNWAKKKWPEKPVGET